MRHASCVDGAVSIKLQREQISALAKKGFTDPLFTLFLPYVGVLFTDFVFIMKTSSGLLLLVLRACTANTTVYNFTGGVQTFNVPSGTNLLFIQASGAPGGRGKRL